MYILRDGSDQVVIDISVPKVATNGIVAHIFGAFSDRSRKVQQNIAIVIEHNKCALVKARL